MVDSIRQFQEQGYRYIRCQMGGYGGKASTLVKPEGAPEGAYYNRKEYMMNHLRMFEHIRAELGFEVELLHDIHERLHPIEAVGFDKDVEEFKLFFLEDALAPEDIEWFRHIRQQCATPQAMGELFNHPHEWTPLIEGRLIDFMRMHVSQMGGDYAGAQCGGFWADVRGAHGLARPGRHLAGGTRGQPALGFVGT